MEAWKEKKRKTRVSEEISTKYLKGYLRVARSSVSHKPRWMFFQVDLRVSRASSPLRHDVCVRGRRRPNFCLVASNYRGFFSLVLFVCGWGQGWIGKKKIQQQNRGMKVQQVQKDNFLLSAQLTQFWFLLFVLCIEKLGSDIIEPTRKRKRMSHG